MATPLILDVDTGVDDLVALLYAAASPEVDLIGATTVFGNVDIDRTARNTLLALERCGLGGVEVAPAPAPRSRGPWTHFPIVHGEEGLGSFVRPPPPGRRRPATRRS